MNVHVTRIWDGKKSWAIKEGRTAADFPLFKQLDIPLNYEFWNAFSGPLGFDLMPKGERVTKELREYFLLAKYLGFFIEDFKVLGDNDHVRSEQKKLRKELLNFDKKKSELGSLVLRLIDNDSKKPSLLKKAISSPKVYKHNFLVKEYVIFGAPRKAKTKKTYFIVQEWVEGDTLEQTLEEDMSKEIYGRLLVFIILSLHLFEQEQKLVDMRGKSLVNTNWFVRTENIIVNIETEDVKFIDTRWLWDMTGNFVEKGILSADMVLHSLLQAFDIYLNEYKKLTTKPS
ncbi:MAG TPA: hypothetical protein ENI23_01120 [bacterium]|nr:hypothetical protein [bacterium]